MEIYLILTLLFFILMTLRVPHVVSILPTAKTFFFDINVPVSSQESAIQRLFYVAVYQIIFSFIVLHINLTVSIFV